MSDTFDEEFDAKVTRSERMRRRYPDLHRQYYNDPHGMADAMFERGMTVPDEMKKYLRPSYRKAVA